MCYSVAVTFRDKDVRKEHKSVAKSVTHCNLQPRSNTYRDITDSAAVRCVIGVCKM